MYNKILADKNCITIDYLMERFMGAKRKKVDHTFEKNRSKAKSKKVQEWKTRVESRHSTLS